MYMCQDPYTVYVMCLSLMGTNATPKQYSHLYQERRHCLVLPERQNLKVHKMLSKMRILAYRQYLFSSVNRRNLHPSENGNTD